MADARMRHCFNCGDEIGVYAGYHPLDTCGKLACEREAREEERQRREEEHERLDRDNGW